MTILNQEQPRMQLLPTMFEGSTARPYRVHELMLRLRMMREKNNRPK